MERLKEALRNPTYIAVINMAIVLIVAAQQYFLADYNTFSIYRNSVYHFFDKLPLYDAYPQEYSGYFFYNPTFSLLFIPFAYLPIPVGILAWGAALMVSFYYGLRLLPIQRDKMIFVYFFSLVSLVTAIQHFDTAPMVAAGIFATFVYVERQDYFRASFFPTIGFFVKGYAAIGACFMLMRRFKRRVYVYVLLMFSFFLILPLVRYSPNELYQIYQMWGSTYETGRGANMGISVMGFFNSFGITVPVITIQILAAILLILTMVIVSLRKTYPKLKFHFLSYILIWVVIFNHLADASTYVIAMPGVAIWYILSKRSWVEKIVLILTFVLTVLASSELFPSYLRENYIFPYALQVVGPALVFMMLQYELIRK